MVSSGVEAGRIGVVIHVGGAAEGAAACRGRKVEKGGGGELERQWGDS